MALFSPRGRPVLTSSAAIFDPNQSYSAAAAAALICSIWVLAAAVSALLEDQHLQQLQPGRQTRCGLLRVVAEARAVRSVHESLLCSRLRELSPNRRLR